MKPVHVYHHLRASDLSLFYIGKGSVKRSKEVRSRNKYWMNTYRKHGWISVLVATFFTEEEALIEEHRQIKLALSMGIRLVNRTLGGEIYGQPLSKTRKLMSESAKKRVQPTRTELWKQNISKGLKGKTVSLDRRALYSKAQAEYCRVHGNQFLGKTHKESSKLRLSRPVYCVNNDTYYLSQKYAAADLGITNAHINQVCKGTRKHTHGYVFRYP